MSIMDMIYKFSDDIRVAVNFGVLPIGLMVWMAGLGTLWEWKETRPKDAKWYLLCGMQSHWTGTILTLAVDLMMEHHMIRVKTAHLIISFNRCFVFAAALLYLKALTEYWKPTLWKYAGIMGVVIIISVYTLRILSCDKQSELKDICALPFFL